MSKDPVMVRAVVIDGFGDEPHLATFPAPELGPDEVLIEVRAASVNAFDWKAAEGRFKDSFEYRFPVTIGRDYTGVVAAAGSAVTRVAPGDEVFGYFTGQALHRGSYATHVWASERECFAARPPGLAADVAACLPLAGVVALRCVDAVAPGAGDRVLILGAPGGVGDAGGPAGRRPRGARHRLRTARRRGVPARPGGRRRHRAR